MGGIMQDEATILRYAVQHLCNGLGSCDYPNCACKNEPHVIEAQKAVELVSIAMDMWQKDTIWTWPAHDLGYKK